MSARDWFNPSSAHHPDQGVYLSLSALSAFLDRLTATLTATSPGLLVLGRLAE